MLTRKPPHEIARTIWAHTRSSLLRNIFELWPMTWLFENNLDNVKVDCLVQKLLSGHKFWNTHTHARTHAHTHTHTRTDCFMWITEVVGKTKRLTLKSKGSHLFCFISAVEAVTSGKWRLSWLLYRSLSATYGSRPTINLWSIKNPSNTYVSAQQQLPSTSTSTGENLVIIVDILGKIPQSKHQQRQPILQLSSATNT